MNLKLPLLTLILLALSWFTPASARLNIEITGGLEGGIPIAIVPFAPPDGAALPEDIAAIVTADLGRTGLFSTMPRDKMTQFPNNGKDIDFTHWRAQAMDNIVVGRILPDARQGAGGYQIEFQLFDSSRRSQLSGFSFQANNNTLRLVAHQISDIIYKQLTGVRGSFNTHISYIMAEDVITDKRLYRLAVADSDGFNEKIVLTSKHPLMSPAWSPNGKQLAYVSFEEGRSMIYLQELATGKRQLIASYPGINSAPRWSPDSKRLAMALSRDGNSEIYTLTLDSKKLERVTNSYAIDTEPDWHPSGKSLLFTSDRGGGPQIYTIGIDANGAAIGQPQRITFEGKYNARGTFSPDGNLIAFIHGRDNSYRVAVQDLQRGTMRILTKSYLDESPSFSANGIMLIYATEHNHRGVLSSVSVDGRASTRLNVTRGDVREPAWSPYLLPESQGN
ncbi:MAG: Tol-Pal system beta propeller repeat protein TolB [Gammaproteobacteria bacterium]|nr:Tol-Pal system beta propeller repeat protein TolB [Gammaproteobacteria bacterium]